MSDVAINIRELNEKIQSESSFVDLLTLEMKKVIVGQRHLIDCLLIGLLSDGHLLLEGVPGLAKTLAINTLARTINARFSRIQFTPDLLPADLIGTMIYSQKKEEFIVKQGPIFANFILADEVNRSPAKVQSALLEAMQEKQVTIGGESFQLPKTIFGFWQPKIILQDTKKAKVAEFVGRFKWSKFAYEYEIVPLVKDIFSDKKLLVISYFSAMYLFRFLNNSMS
ncbi:MAG: AAA domain-containing protein [Bacteroidales bacterium]|nr:AAA domain-containing protein [Bacteroidales bacterium]